MIRDIVTWQFYSQPEAMRYLSEQREAMLHTCRTRGGRESYVVTTDLLAQTADELNALLGHLAKIDDNGNDNIDDDKIIHVVADGWCRHRRIE